MMKKTLFAILFFLGFVFVSLNYAKADVPAYVCSSSTTYAPGTVVRCGLLPNFCTSCNLYNHVVNCTADSSGHLPATIDMNTCTYVEDLLHEANAAECAEEASCKPPPVCPGITCVGNSGAGGSCSYPASPNVDIGSCTSYKCASAPNGVPGHTISVCQSNNCYFNSCECWPNAPCPAPVQAPTSCPVPPAVTNVRVECPYCL